MSTFKRKLGHGQLAAVVSSFATKMNEEGAHFASPAMTEQLVSMESLSEVAHAEFVRDADDFSKDIAASFEDLMGGVALEGFQTDAGAIAAMAAGDVQRYHAAAISTDVSSDGVQVVSAESAGRFGTVQFAETASMESFDNQELSRHIPYSIAFNVQASRQDEFGEAFYPTVVVTPDQAGLDITINRTLVLEEVRHQTSGKVNGWNRRSLLDAVVDSAILANDATRIVPVVLADDSNADQFIDAALIAPREEMVDRVPVRTAPLKIAKEVDLLGISEHQGLIGAGLLDSTDSLDARVGLDTLYVSMSATVDNGAGGTKDVTEIFGFNVSRMPRADFVKSVEGDAREMNLVFGTDNIILTKDKKTVQGAASEVLAALAANNYNVRLKVNVNGSVNLETSHANAFATPTVIAGVYEVDTVTGAGTEIAMSDAAATAVVAAMGQIEIAGYTLRATRSNSNLRTRGLLLNTNQYTERYTIPMGSPISVPAPVHSDRSANDLSSLITAARIYTSNNAVTSLLNYGDALGEYVNNLPAYGEDGLTVEGIGRYLVKPFYEHFELDLRTAINSISSHERSADVKALLVDTIREMAYRAYRDSNYQTAMDALTGAAGGRPSLVIGTDATIAQHLMVSGDSRTAGISFDHEIVQSNDKRMSGKIVFSFKRKGAAGADPLSFGAHAWIPELTSTLAVTRQGATVKETTVQPRSRHVNCLPIMGVIEVKGTEVLRKKA